MPNKRLFVAIELPEPLKDSLVRLNPNQPRVRWVQPEQMHLTLAFFGNVDAATADELRQRLLEIRWMPFFIPVIRVGTFPAKGRPKIIWIGVGTGHPHLFQLHKRVQESALAVGLKPDLRPWHPHITLARCQDVSRESVQRFLREHEAFDAGMIRVTSITLFSSVLTPSGPKHARELTVSA